MSQFNINKVENNGGAQSIGDSSSATVVNNHAGNEGLADITKQLIELISQNSDMPQDTQNELSEAVSAVSEQAQEDKPNKTIIGALFGTIEKVISVAEKTPALISVYDKWKTFIEPFIA
ncbi:hypothetical protein [Paenibacillus polymyxa]|uniref:hypothetical protein n=1 Tax=Paenibacillus polymyxa TaxID=1406 RepID=UPI000737ADE5|nr:hypothetical protein [Paenibacillus polymyxa]